MADITKCLGTLGSATITCPMREQCYRYTATANEFWQSYFTVTPIKISGDNVPSCEHFWRNDER